jgi:hypothetical protein
VQTPIPVAPVADTAYDSPSSRDYFSADEFGAMERKTGAWKTPVRVLCVLLAVAGAGGAVWQHLAIEDRKTSFNEAKAAVVDNPTVGNYEAAEKIKKEADNAAFYRNIFAGVGVAGIAGGFITLFF